MAPAILNSFSEFPNKGKEPVYQKMERRISVGIFRPKDVDHLQAEISEIFGIMKSSHCVYQTRGHPNKER